MTHKRIFIACALLALCAGPAAAQTQSAQQQAVPPGVPSAQTPPAAIQPPAPSGANPANDVMRILPTAEKKMPATPTTQPGLQPGSPSAYPGQKSPAAPTRQPILPNDPNSPEGLTSIQTQTKALALPPPPDLSNQKGEPVEAETGKKPYLPPELRDKTTPLTNIMLPPLYGWNRIVMNDLVMPADRDVVTSCGMQKDFIFKFLAQRLQDGGIPLMSRQQSDLMVPDPVIAVATPTIVSMQDLVINCTSWVQFQVTAELTFRVPPLMYRRKVPIQLWHDGMLVTSAKSTHNGALINAFIELAMRFRGAWDAQQGMVDPAKVLR